MCIRAYTKAVGSAPILRQPFFKISPSKTWAVVEGFLRRELSLPGASLFLYLAAAFSPSPEDQLDSLCHVAGVEGGTLVVHYSLTPAWG